MRSYERWTMPDFVAVPLDAVEPEAPSGPTPEEEAYARGYADGYQAGAEEAGQKVRSVCQVLEGVTESLRAVQAACASELEETLTTLALAIARQIVQREVTLDPTVVGDLVRRAAESVPLDATLDIRVHPADLAALGADPHLYGAGGRRLEVHWIGDGSLERGSYVIETPQRIIDGELDGVLKILYERLRDV
jgi:flagellar assembly protein FliH